MGEPATALVLLCAVVFLAAVAGSVRDVWLYPGEDVRPKVTSVRALLRGLNPYTYEVGPDTPEELVDYMRPWAKRVNTSSTPTFLLLYMPTSSLPWRVQRLLWMVLEWMALTATILLLVRCCGRPTYRLLFFCIACIFFAGSYFWRLHVERGQDYVFLALLQALGAFWCLRRRGDVVSGIPIGAAIALRPTLLAVAPVLWIVGRRRMVYSALATGALVVLATLPWVGIAGWVEFQKAVAQLEQLALGNQELEAWLGQPYRPPSPVVEGYDYSLRTYIPAHSANVTFTSLGSTVLAHFMPRGFLLRAWPPITRGLAVLTVIGFAGLAWLGRRAGLSTRAGLALAILSGLVMDYLLGVIRTSYQDILFLVPIALMLPILLDRRTPRQFAFLVVGGLICGSIGWIVLGVALRSAGVVGGLVMCATWLCVGGRHKAS